MADSSKIVEAQADFAVKLLREVSKGGEGESTILSPTSVAIALAMVYAGAKGETAKQLGKMLANGVPESKVHDYFGELLEALISNGQKNNYTLELADKVYVKSGFPVLDTYKAVIQHHYKGLFESVDFGQRDDTARKINSFVEEATHDKIHDLVQPDMLNANTRLILINAIYFKGSWAKKFEVNWTKKKPFYVSKGNEKQVDMMQKTAAFIYIEKDDYQVLGMPYVGEELIMFIVLPKEHFGLDKVLAKMTGAKLLKLVQNRRKVEVDVFLPKFKLESTHDLNQPLVKLGCGRAFSDSAQFEGITTTTTTTKEARFKIDKFIQKAFIEMNEEGTEAAAATEVVLVSMLCDGKFRRSAPTPQFKADHPFAFFIVPTTNNNNNAQILFNGFFKG